VVAAGVPAKILREIDFKKSAKGVRP
jgi:hypothetical protein